MAFPVALASMAGSLVGGILNQNAQQANNATQIGMMNKQNQFNLDMWNRQNAYNLPVAQMQRYRDAGINPFMAMSQITGGNSASVPTAAPAPSLQPVTGLADSVSQAIPQAIATLEAAARARKTIYEADNQKVKNKYADEMYMTDLQKNKNEADTSGYKKRQEKVQADLVEYTIENQKRLSDFSVTNASNELYMQSLRAQAQEIQNDIQDFYYKTVQPQEARNLMKDYEIKVQDLANKIVEQKLTYMQIRKAASDIALNMAQRGLVNAQRDYVGAQKIGVDNENSVFEKTKQSIINQAIWQSNLIGAQNKMAQYSFESQSAINPTVNAYIDKFSDVASSVVGAFGMARGFGMFKGFGKFFGKGASKASK